MKKYRYFCFLTSSLLIFAGSILFTLSCLGAPDLALQKEHDQQASWRDQQDHSSRGSSKEVHGEANSSWSKIPSKESSKEGQGITSTSIKKMAIGRCQALKDPSVLYCPNKEGTRLIQVFSHKNYTIVSHSLSTNERYFALLLKPREGTGLSQFIIKVANVDFGGEVSLAEPVQFKTLRAFPMRKDGSSQVEGLRFWNNRLYAHGQSYLASYDAATPLPLGRGLWHEFKSLPKGFPFLSHMYKVSPSLLWGREKKDGKLMQVGDFMTHWTTVKEKQAPLKADEVKVEGQAIALLTRTKEATILQWRCHRLAPWSRRTLSKQLPVRSFFWVDADDGSDAKRLVLSFPKFLGFLDEKERLFLLSDVLNGKTIEMATSLGFGNIYASTKDMSYLVRIDADEVTCP